MTVEVNIQVGMKEKLEADTILAALVPGGFHDYVPNRTTEPYITFGEIDSSEWDTKTWNGQDCTLSIHVWATDEGRKLCKEIMDRVYAVLHRQKLTVVGASVVHVRYLESNVDLDVDGITHHGTARYQILVQID